MIVSTSKLPPPSDTSNISDFAGVRRTCRTYLRTRRGLRCKSYRKGSGEPPCVPGLKGGGRVGRTRHCRGVARRAGRRTSRGGCARTCAGLPKRAYRTCVSQCAQSKRRR